MQLSIKYRPESLDTVFGQEVTKTILLNSHRLDRVPTAICLSGMHGTGKTTLARIYAALLNCQCQEDDPQDTCDSCRDIKAGTAMYVHEKDAASNNGVDDVRQLQEDLQYNAEGNYRVVILDEAHQLSKAAQAALLKIIEEPPQRTVFVLVTTDPQMLEKTVRSRCMNLRCLPLTTAELESSLAYVLEQEGIEYTPEFLQLLGRQGNGSVRDSLQVLDQIISYNAGRKLDEEVVSTFLGLFPKQLYKDLAYCLTCLQISEFLGVISEWYSSGVDLEGFFTDGVPVLMKDFMYHLNAPGLIAEYECGISADAMSRNMNITYEHVRYFLQAWEQTLTYMKFSNHPKLIWELFAAKVCGGQQT